jgi:hypothetical protein
MNQIALIKKNKITMNSNVKTDRKEQSKNYMVFK